MKSLDIITAGGWTSSSKPFDGWPVIGWTDLIEPMLGRSFERDLLFMNSGLLSDIRFSSSIFSLSISYLLPSTRFNCGMDPAKLFAIRTSSFNLDGSSAGGRKLRFCA